MVGALRSQINLDACYPACILCVTSSLISPSSHMIDPKYLNSATCGMTVVGCLFQILRLTLNPLVSSLAKIAIYILCLALAPM